ncbi:MAG: SPOR domain-containing protein [Gammaproteobacteria bacterium]|nr:SPOR domain-containing protein [Gammaproteobacteria bacterium]
MQLLKFWVFIPLFILITAINNGAYGKTLDQKNYKYVINLSSSKKPLKVQSIKNRNIRRSYNAYRVVFSGDTKFKYRYRLGFFTSRKQAQKVLNELAVDFKGAWLDQVRDEDQIALKKWLVRKQSVSKKLKKLNDDELTRLMESARVAMIGKKYKSAIRIYTRVLDSQSNQYQQEAQEYLGVARERNGQLAHAKAEYRLYLEKYPEGENAQRVIQRLNALVTAYNKPKKDLPVFEQKKKPDEWRFFGSLLQFYDRDVVDTALLGDIVANSLVSTNVNYAGRFKAAEYKMATDFAATHVYDLQDSETDDERITSMYFDYQDLRRHFDARFGRQKGRSSGVVGRFDGVDLGYQLTPFYKLKFITGIPVEKYKTVDSSKDKRFYAAGLEIGPINKYWDASFFYLEQTADGIVDRKEVGAEARYRTRDTSLFALFDYSIEFDEINYFMTVYNRRFKDRSTLDVIADYRKSPFLTTTSALIGQTGVSTLGDMLDTNTEQEIEQLAQDRTSLFKSMSVLYSRPLLQNVELNTDFNVSSLSDTQASAGVESIEGTGNEYSASVGVVANKILTANDVNIANFRLSNLFNSDVMVLSLSSRYRLNRAWRVNPRLSIEQRSYEDGRNIDKLKPSIKAKYRASRRWHYEMELSYEDKETSTPGEPVENESSYRLHLGYIFNF